MTNTTQRDNNFNVKTVAQIDAKLDRDYEEYKKRRLKTIIISAIIIFLLIPDAFLYWFRFATPHFAKYTTRETINISNPPIQTDINSNEDRIIMYKTLENRGTYRLEKLANYSISGMVLATNYYFWGNYLPGGDRSIQSIMLFDIGIAWGKLADKRILKSFRFYSAKDITGRYLTPRFRRGVKNPPMTYKEAHNYYSHTHVIPASSSIMYALIYARKHQKIKMDGYLVRIYTNRETIDSSMTRDDHGCEIMYVKRIQVGNKVYE